MRYYSDVHLAETKNRRTRELHQSGAFKREKGESENVREKNAEEKDRESVKFELSYVHNEFQNVMVPKYCICVLSLKIYTEMLIAGLTFLQIFICKHLTRGVSR